MRGVAQSEKSAYVFSSGKRLRSKQYSQKLSAVKERVASKLMDVFERFFNLSSDLFIVTNGRGRIERVNSRWKDILGYEPNELEGRQVYEIFHPADVEASIQARDVANRLGSYRDFENRCMHKNGSIVWMKWHGFLDSETGCLYVAGIDVTPEKVAIQSLELESISLVRERERSTILRELIEAARDGFGYCDPDFRPLYLNRFLAEELGWSLGETSLLNLLSPATRTRYEIDLIPAVFGRREVWEGEVEFLNIRTGESIPIWQKTFCVFGSDGRPQYLAFFATDLRTKRQAEAAIIHSSKMASLGQMAAGIAHEINNPITIIHGTAGLLKKALQSDAPDIARITSGLERIEKTALRISRIIRGLRMFSRSGESDPPLTHPLRTILEETLDLCRERFRDYEIDFRIAEMPEVSIRCRPTQISQVLLNLLNNSFDAISNETERWVQVDFAKRDGKVRISITDSGPGLSKETQRRLMEPFFTTKEPGKGTGLGLPISRGIVEEHGGKLTYERDSKNTCFAIELPVKGEAVS
jgi:PAS domain S-box-containing protein